MDIEFTKEELSFCLEQGNKRNKEKKKQLGRSGWKSEITHVLGILGEFALQKYLNAQVNFELYGAKGDEGKQDATLNGRPILCKTVCKAKDLWLPQYSVEKNDENTIIIVIKVEENTGLYLQKCSENKEDTDPSKLKLRFLGWCEINEVIKYGTINKSFYFQRNRDPKEICIVNSFNILKPIEDLSA